MDNRKDSMLEYGALLIMSMMCLVYILYVFTTITVMMDKADKSTTHILVVKVKAPEKVETKPVAREYPEVELKTLSDKAEPKQKKGTDIETKSEVEVKEEPKKEPKKDDDSYLLAQIIHAEARGETYDGKVAVGNVIMNRVDSDDFPDTIKDVIFQKGQFSPVSNGSINNEPGSEALKAAKAVLDGVEVVDSRALYFYNPNTSTSQWIFSRQTIKDIGNHRFAY